VLAFAAAGVYPADRVRQIPPDLLERWFTPHRNGNRVAYHVKPELRSLITFKQLNLLEAWPMRGPFQAIFCRNVIIYFDSPTKMELIRRFGGLLPARGHLFLGHSESLVSTDLGFAACGRSAYRKAEVT
jgi:chemotaxis protein methyltransferase CheR